jgi:hypothetical protein
VEAVAVSRGYAQRRDTNEIAIIEALEIMGYTVERCYIPCPFDLLVGRSGPVRLPMEVKMPGGKVEESQAEYFLLWPDLIVYTPDDAIAAAEKYL